MGLGFRHILESLPNCDWRCFVKKPKTSATLRRSFVLPNRLVEAARELSGPDLRDNLRDTVFLAFQLRSIDSSRLLEYAGVLPNEKMLEVDAALRRVLSL